MAAILLAGCAQRVTLKRTPYGIEDLVYIPDRYFDVTYPAGAPGAACTQMDVVFLPTADRVTVTYELEIGTFEDKRWDAAPFAYELVVLSLPNAQDQAYQRAADPARAALPEQQAQIQQHIAQARDAPRATAPQTCRAPEPPPDPEQRQELHFAGALAGALKVALLTASGELRPGTEYRLSFFREPRRRPAGSAPAPVTIGRFEFRVVNNTNYVGLPVGLGLGFGFLLVSTKFLAP
jgi:hypothetical protein